MAKTYFKKSLVFNPVRLSGGRVIKWIRYNRADGIIETEDADEVAALSRLAQNNQLGISEITKEQFDELKKNPIVTVADGVPRVLERVDQSLFPKAKAKPQPREKKSAAAGNKAESKPPPPEKPVTATGVFDSNEP